MIAAALFLAIVAAYNWAVTTWPREDPKGTPRLPQPKDWKVTTARWNNEERCWVVE